jgi:hypothetical protein
VEKRRVFRQFNGTQLFYTDQITDQQADALGNYLVSSEFADGEYKTVQMTKEGNTYQFRMVVKQGIDSDPLFVNVARGFGVEISNTVFNGAQLEVHFCDNDLKTLRVIPMAMYDEAQESYNDTSTDSPTPESNTASGFTKDELEREVKASIIAENNDPTIRIISVSLIKSAQDNLYEGFLNTMESGVSIQYNLAVIVDGDEYIWEIY